MLHSVVVAVLESDETLSDLEEVAIGLIRGEVDVEDKVAVGSDFLLCGQHLERVLH